MTLAERLEQLVDDGMASYRADGYTVAFWVCEICGYAKWRSASCKGEGFKVVVDNGYPTQECPWCLDVQSRAPEVFRWVLAVIFHRKERDESSDRQEPL